MRTCVLLVYMCPSCVHAHCLCKCALSVYMRITCVHQHFLCMCALPVYMRTSRARSYITPTHDFPQHRLSKRTAHIIFSCSNKKYTAVYIPNVPYSKTLREQYTYSITYSNF